MKFIVHVLAQMLLVLPGLVTAQIPSTISYQGFLESSGQPVNASVSITVRLFLQPAGGAAIWTQSFPSVSVNKGVYSLMLDVSGLNFTAPYWLETEINGTVSSSRTALGSVPYALGPWTIGTVGGAAPQKVNMPLSPKMGPANQPIFYIGGNVGIGTTTPNLRLGIAGGVPWTTNGWSGDIELEHGGAIGWRANSAGMRFGMGHTDGGLFMFRTSNDPGTATAQATYDFLLSDSGNVSIGPVSPVDRLNVGGNASFTGTVSVGRQIAVNRRALIGGPAIQVRTTNLGNVTSTDFMVDDVGFVGVGTDAPQSNFNVVGTSWFQGDNTPLNPAAGKGIAVGFPSAGNAGYLFAFDYGTLTPKDLLLNNPGGNVGIGTTNPTAKLDVAGHTKTQVLEITGGSDLAEPFETATGRLIKPGMVMVIDAAHPGKLVPSGSSYDRRVAGIVSGAGGIHAGVMMRQRGILEGGSMIAIAGRVYCMAEASSAPIQPGDLLTTSDIEGHAMRAVDDARSRGAIIGKAMTALKEGKGLVLVLVNLQ